MHAPLFTIVTLVTIAIGIGANSVIFSVIDGVLLNPSRTPKPERLVSTRQKALFIGMTDVSASRSDYFTFKEENRTFERFGIWNGDNVSVTGGALKTHGAKAVSVVGGSFGGAAAGDASIKSAPGEIDRIVFLGAAPNLSAEKLKSRALFIVARDDADVLYGTTLRGGNQSCQLYGATGCGTVFRITP